MNVRTIVIAAAALGFGVVLGWLLPGGASAPAAGSAATDSDMRGRERERERASEPLYWVAPMDPSYRRDGPGTSPMGMELVPVYEDEGADVGVRVPASVQHNFGVRVEPVRRGPLDAPVRAVGSVMLAEPLVEHVHTRTAGWIERLAAKIEGDPVTSGDLLLELYSPELVRAQEEFLLATEPTLRRASRDRLRALGMTTAQIDALRERGKVRERTELRATRDGFIVNLPVREGMFVEPRTEVLAVAGLDPVWVVAEVFERDVPRLAEGQPAELAFDFLPGRTFTGEVDYLYPTLDVARRTLRVRMVFENPDLDLRPGMFGDVRIRSASDARPLSVPASALIRGTGEAPDRVVVQLSEDRFRSRAVHIGRVDSARVEVLAGLREGERVVTSGQFLIDSESDVDAELVRMGAMNQGSMNQRSIDQSSMDHDSMDHGSKDQDSMDHDAMDHGSMEHGSTDQSSTDHCSKDQGSTDHGSMDHGSTDHGSMNHGSMDHGSTTHESADHTKPASNDVPKPGESQS
ncbi:MAG: efflux RND transporter periplasmic adaptor subunit [Pseudomonadota bacterium]|nr:efflux RND transporter periplasmic adaptor subunit [Pseudomonadota bacterium]